MLLSVPVIYWSDTDSLSKDILLVSLKWILPLVYKSPDLSTTNFSTLALFTTVSKLGSKNKFIKEPDKFTEPEVVSNVLSLTISATVSISLGKPLALSIKIASPTLISELNAPSPLAIRVVW